MARRTKTSYLGTAIGIGALSLSVLQGQAPTAPIPEPTPEQAAFFETKIRPVLATNCTSCHGKDAQLGGLRLDTRAGLVKGGDTGPGMVPGDPAGSLLIQAIHQAGKLKMPKGGKLKPAEIADIEAWIKMGAPWPTSTSLPGKVKEPLWSLQPVQNPPIPKPGSKGWAINPIDHFVLAKLEANKLRPAEPADRRTLLRRISYDLIGLPPTPAEVDAFLADKAPGAYERVVDRLLASPHYGERWGRHWLDVARYADTKGYMFEEDRNYPNAYTYRQWVIDAFNRDLPYDQFITEQLAADRLELGEDKRPLAALGFLTVGRRFLNSQPDIMDDRIDVTMRGFQGFTVACARCHDHKFDPIPTQDYYSLYAVFASTQEALAPISEKAIRDPWIAYNDRKTKAEMAIRSLQLAQVLILRAPGATPSAEVKEVLKGFREGDLPSGDNLSKLEKGFTDEARNQLAGFRQELALLAKNVPATPEFAMAMTDNANPADGVVFKRGNPGNPGISAPRRFLAALSKPGTEREHWAKSSGRLELARSIASRNNPLTARVFVNRVWLQHFGAGIVRTPSDFGHQGEKPTDLALLDYLASYFMDHAWSIKRLHRLIVLSATYRQSSTVEAAKYNADPDNRLLSRMNRRRLDLEQMRDSVMAVAGKLDSSVGGKSVDIWSAPFSGRRALYGYVDRQNLPSVFRTFDFASPDSTNAQRFRTTVPQQALFFMNSPFAVEQARAIASQPEVQKSTDPAQQVRRLYRRLFGRLPDPEEASAGVAYLGVRGKLPAPASIWQYGYGNGQTFTPLTEFGGNGYQVGKAFPDSTLGYILINAQGAHPGHDDAHSAIRRWISPVASTLRISGNLNHQAEPGDGVAATVFVNGRVIAKWQAHHQQVATPISSLAVRKGDVVDFVISPQSSDNSDATAWTVQIVATDGKSWDSEKGFGPPAPASLDRLILYAQALMMSNEFMFVD